MKGAQALEPLSAAFLGTLSGSRIGSEGSRTSTGTLIGKWDIVSSGFKQIENILIYAVRKKLKWNPVLNAIVIA